MSPDVSNITWISQDFLYWKKPTEFLSSISLENPLCGDRSDCYLVNLVNNSDSPEICFHGEACSLVEYSSEVLGKYASKTPPREWKQTMLEIENFALNISVPSMVPEKIKSMYSTSILNELEKRPHRWKCILLPWRSLLHMVETSPQFFPDLSSKIQS